MRERSQWIIKNALNIHILPVIGSLEVRKIKPIQLEKLMRGMDNKSNSLQAKVHWVLHAVFNYAMENGIIEKSPVTSNVRVAGIPTEEKKPLTPEDCQKLLTEITNRRTHTFLLIALRTGMRRGEIIALQWDDIDFKNRVIHVCHNASISDKRTVISEDMKTKAAVRDIPMPDDLFDWLMKEEEESKSKFVIHMDNKQPLTKSAYSSMWCQVTKCLPEKKVTAHILRHTYITRLFEAGLDIKQIQYLAGHSSPQMTLRVYTHYDKESRASQTLQQIREAFR